MKFAGIIFIVLLAYGECNSYQTSKFSCFADHYFKIYCSLFSYYVLKKKIISHFKKIP